MRPMNPTSAPVPLRAQPRSRAGAVFLVVAALASIAVLTAFAVPAFATHAVRVHAVQNRTLHKRIVVTASGRTLYTLSVEKHGRFVCTGSCLSTWPLLKVPAGSRVVGVAKLGVVKRPDGIRQATLNGHPLYTFAGDSRKGDVNGEGFRDVGTWHAAAAPRAAHH
ncbi:MAG TPA: hypothetical protein VFU94_09650 [Conexibacter sp.]|nr:hypothetical protein [Conexibacter sp.]